MNLNTMLQQSQEIKHYQLEEKFYSKRNHVYKVRLVYHDGTEVIRVVKSFNGKTDTLYKEVNMLIKLKENGLAVPSVYYIGEDYFVMEYLEGDTLLDIITLIENGQIVILDGMMVTKSYLVVEICKWFQSFYKITENRMDQKLIFNDTHLRNFILSDKLYAIDLEGVDIGKPETDCGKMCAYILTYSPRFTVWKREFVQQLMHGFNNYLDLCRENIVSEMQKELTNIEKRRK